MTTVAKAMVGAKHAAENVLQAATMFAPKKFDFKHTTNPDGGFTRKEVENASHNHGIHPEALVYDVTPTGLHYILRHFDTPCLEPGQVESGKFHLSILGLVENRLSVSLEDIKSRPSVTHRVVMECSGNGRTRMTPRYNLHTPWNVEGVGCAEWKGTPLKPLLEEAGLKPEARDIVFVGLDKGVCEGKLRYFERSIRANDPILEDCFLAYEMNGRPLEPQHGYPLRLIVPGWYGMMSIKWLQAIEVIDHVFQGYWNQTYSYTKEERDVEVRMPVTEMKPKALIVPPGVLMMETHHRIIEQGAHKLQGRCWVGGKGNSIAKVEVSFDDGKTWDEATVTPKPAELPFTWQKWTYSWLAIEGTYSFRLRATDVHGATQPLEVDDALWNYHGLGNNVAISMTFVVVKKYDLEVEWTTSESSVTRAFLKLVGER